MRKHVCYTNGFNYKTLKSNTKKFEMRVILYYNIMKISNNFELYEKQNIFALLLSIINLNHLKLAWWWYKTKNDCKKRERKWRLETTIGSQEQTASPEDHRSKTLNLWPELLSFNRYFVSRIVARMQSRTLEHTRISL